MSALKEVQGQLKVAQQVTQGVLGQICKTQRNNETKNKLIRVMTSSGLSQVLLKIIANSSK